MRHAGHLVAGLCLACFGIALALLVAEIGVRGFHLVPAEFWEPDPLLGSRLIPGKAGWWTQEEHEFRVHVRVNDAGFRDVEHALAKPPGTTRVLLLGDSFVEAMQVPLASTLARRLEARLNSPSGPRRYEVVSMGVSGYGTAGESLLYGTVGRNYKPDVILLAFYPGNDVRNNSPTLEATLPPKYDASGRLQRVTAAGGKGRRRAGGPLAKSQAYRYVRKLIVTQHPALAGFLARNGMLDPGAIRHGAERNGIPVDYGVYVVPVSAEWRQAWAYTEALLDALRLQIQRDGARFAILVVTSREIVYPETWQTIVDQHPAMRSARFDVSGPEKRIMRWCADRRVACLRLSEAFLVHANGHEPLHYHYDGHWTAAGHALAARVTAAFLCDTGLLEKCGRED